MNKLPNILILAELVLLLFIFIISWLLSALGYEVQNMLSAQGLRWLFSHHTPEWESTILLWSLWVTTAVGCIKLSGLWDEVLNLLHGRRKPSPRKYRYALRLSAILASCFIIFLLHCAFAPSSPLLGVTGNLLPSPFLDGLLPIVCLGIILVSLVFARASQRFVNWTDTMGLLPQSLAKYASWVVLLFISGYLYNICNYVF